MLSLLKNWKGKVEVNGKLYDSIDLVSLADIKDLEAININLFEVKTTGLLFTKDTLKIAKQGLSL